MSDNIHAQREAERRRAAEAERLRLAQVEENKRESVRREAERLEQVARDRDKT